jgi:hypothetical protein
MNKRIKKKKAKQALEHQQEQFKQTLEDFDPQTIQIAFQEIVKPFRATSKSLEIVFENIRQVLEAIADQIQQEDFSEKIRQQGTSTARQRTFQVQRLRPYNQTKTRRVDHKRPREYFKRRT